MMKQLKPILITAGIALGVLFVVFRLAPAPARKVVVGITPNLTGTNPNHPP